MNSDELLRYFQFYDGSFALLASDPASKGISDAVEMFLKTGQHRLREAKDPFDSWQTRMAPLAEAFA